MLRGRKLATAAVAGGLVLSLGLTACGDDDDGGTTTPGGDDGAPVTGGTLNMLGISDVDYMDPNISYYSLGYLALRQWTRQLFSFEAVEGENSVGGLNSEVAKPDLAVELPTKDNGGISDDGQTYTVEIREGAQWNTTPPRQITAADVVRGVKRSCNPSQPYGGLPNYLTLLEGFKKFCDDFAKVSPVTAASVSEYINDTELAGVEAQDERTVVFHLNSPAAYFVDMMALPAFSPAPEEWDRYLPGSGQLAQNTISSGPYQVESYRPTKRLVFTRNPAWDADTDDLRNAYVDRIIINMTVSQESTQQQLQTGRENADISFGNFPPPSLLNGLIRRNDPQLTVGPTSSTNPYVLFNHESPNNDGAMKKQAFREALMYGINRANIIQSLGGPNVNNPLTQVLPPNILGGEQKIDLYPYNEETAKQKLAEAGFPDGLTLKFLYRPASEGSRKTFATVQADLQKIGIKVEGVQSPDADFYTKYLQVPSVAKRGVWDLSLAGWGADWAGNAALSFFKPLFYDETSFPPNGSNFGFYKSDAAIEKIDAAAEAQSTEEAAQLWHEADEQVMKDAAFFPITNPKQALYHAEHVKNAVYMPAFQGYDPSNIWLEEGKQGG